MPDTLDKRQLTKFLWVNFGHVYCRESDKKFIKKYKTATTDILGGVIVENKDKSIRIN